MRGPLAEVAELAVGPFGAEGVERVEDLLGSLLGVASGGVVTSGELEVGEVGERAGLTVAIADVPEQRDGVLVARDCLRRIAELGVGLAQT